MRQILLLFLLFNNSLIIHALFSDYPSANPPFPWLNNPSSLQGNWRFSDNTFVRTILALENNGFPHLCFGFYNNGTSDTFFLVIMKVPKKVPENIDYKFTIYDFPPVVLWTANGISPVRENATLAFTNTGLVLKDANGATVWARGGSTLATMDLSLDGNLRLISENNRTMWESFQEPTNTWLPGQSLLEGHNLYSTISTNDLATGLFSLRLDNDSARCIVGSMPPQRYCSLLTEKRHLSFDFFIGSLNRSGNVVTYFSKSQDFQYLRLQPNGSLSVFRFLDNKEVFYFDLLSDQLLGPCDYPTVCGRYGVCKDSKCTCAGDDQSRTSMKYFKQVNATRVDLGCQAVDPISCGDIKNHGFLEIPNVDYFWSTKMKLDTNASVCKENCLRNCSCKAALFRYRDEDSSKGTCLLLNDVFSLMAAKNESYSTITYVKIQNRRTKSGSGISITLLIPSLIASGVLVMIFGACYCYVARRKNRSFVVEKEEERSMVNIPPVVKRFSFQELNVIAKEFRTQLGKGGYGEVFEGTMENGTKVAIKKLFERGKTEFVPEVETIGRVHHFNLVRLIGYCAEKSNRLLVYEYVQKGSLDKWIFTRNNQEKTLSWKIKWRIILGVAKGLEYLHEHCNPKIIHFDIKPQNILLDEEFNVKIADFGLAKWIERDQSKVVTMAKGTIGYMAPELIGGRNVSVKVDVYSFGIVILEIVCGMRNSDKCRKDVYLIDEVKTKAEEGRLGDLVDKSNEEKEGQKEEAVKAMEIGIRCLQPQKIRPSMPIVVKLLEGMVDLESISDYSFLTMFHDPGDYSPVVINCSTNTCLVNSILSGPR